jgi:hypothetical protein
MFQALLSFFKRVFQILNKNICHTFFKGDLISSKSEKLFAFNTPFEFWKQPEVSWSQVRRIRRMVHGRDAFSCQSLRHSTWRIYRRVVVAKNQWAISLQISSLAPYTTIRIFNNSTSKSRWRSRYSYWLWVGQQRVRSSRPDSARTFFSTSSRPISGPTQPPIQWVRGALSLGIKWPGNEADNSTPASAEVKKMWIYTLSLPYAFMAQCLIRSTGKTLRFLPYHVKELKAIPCNRPWRPVLSDVKVLIFSIENRLMAVKLSALSSGRPLPSTKFPDTHFC